MKFLVFQHVKHEHPGLMTDFAQKKGIKLNIVELWKSYKIPSLNSYKALIIMGGPIGVYEGLDVFPSKNDEIGIIRKSIGKIPILGFCLGSQLLAAALGAQVYPNIKNGKHIKEIGYYSVNLTEDGQKDHLFKGFSANFQVLQWHGDTFDLPSCSALLATSRLCKNQVFSYGKAYGLLFHLEFTPVMIEKQIEIDNEWIHKDFVIDERKLLDLSKKNTETMEKQCILLLNNFLNII